MENFFSDGTTVTFIISTVLGLLSSGYMFVKNKWLKKITDRTDIDEVIEAAVSEIAFDYHVALKVAAGDGVITKEEHKLALDAAFESFKEMLKDRKKEYLIALVGDKFIRAKLSKMLHLVPISPAIQKLIK